jgi:hypothetical protein
MKPRWVSRGRGSASDLQRPCLLPCSGFRPRPPRCLSCREFAVPAPRFGPPGRPGAHSPHLAFRKAFTAPGDIFTRLSPSLLPVFSTLAGFVHRAILPCSARSVTPPGLFVLEPEFSASHFLPHFFVPVAGEYSKIPSPCLRTEPFHAWSTRFKVEFRLAA